MSNILRGTGVALVTPFKEDHTIDFEGLTNLINHCILGGVEYLVALGTTAESATLSKEEKEQVAEHIVKITDKRVPLVIGIGGNNTQLILEEIKQFDLKGFDAILSVVPMYNKPTQEGLFQHYKVIQEKSPLPILLYNVPSRTGTNMTTETTLRLSQLDNIIGIKEAVSDLTQTMKIIKDSPEDFLVISGDDALALPAVLAGGDGVISVVGQGFSQDFSEMIRLGLQGKPVEAYQLLYKLWPALDYAFAEGNPAGIKQILSAKGICESKVRLPLVPASQKLTAQISKFIEELEEVYG